MVKHVLKDGSEVKGIEGYVIRMDQFDHLYKVIDSISRKEGDVNAVISASD